MCYPSPPELCSEGVSRTNKMKNKFVILPAVSVAGLLAVGGAIAGVSVYQDYSYTKATNVQMASELSNVRVDLYVASGDIKAGDPIVYEGEGKNVELSQIYSSIPIDYYIDGETGYAQTDIPEGSPVMKSQVADTEPLLTLEPERIIEEVPESFSLPYLLTGKHVDRRGNELHEDTQITLGEGVGEQALWLFQEPVEGYYLDSVTIEGRKVFSIGAERVQDVDGTEMYYYYTSEDALTRTELTEDKEVVFTYRQGDMPEYQSTSRFTGIPETAEEEESSGSEEEGLESAIVFEDIEGQSETEQETGSETEVETGTEIETEQEEKESGIEEESRTGTR